MSPFDPTHAAQTPAELLGTPVEPAAVTVNPAATEATDPAVPRRYGRTSGWDGLPLRSKPAAVRTWQRQGGPEESVEIHEKFAMWNFLMGVSRIKCGTCRT